MAISQTPGRDQSKDPIPPRVVPPDHGQATGAKAGGMADVRQTTRSIGTASAKTTVGTNRPQPKPGSAPGTKK